MAVTYHNQNIEFNLKDKRKVSRWINICVADEGCKTGRISMIFCSDDDILSLNKKHLNHDYYTDIITFDYSEEGKIKTISGDLFISLDTVADNAKKYGVDFMDELRRVMIHGVLHLMGYNDKSEKETPLMREKENHYLSLYQGA